MTNTKRLGTVAILTGIALALLAPAASAQKTAPAADKAAKAVEAPSPCKGLEQAQCGKKGDACIWRAASKRKDGVEVKAHCRKKPDITKAQAALAAKKNEAAPAAKASTTPAPAKPAATKPVETTKAAVKKAVTPPPAPAAPVKAN